MQNALNELARILADASAPARDGELMDVGDLAAIAGMSVRTLQSRCFVAGMTAHRCVRLAQCLQYVRLGNLKGQWDREATLPVLDPRTMRLLISQAGFNKAACPTVEEFLLNQTFFDNAALRNLLIRLCSTPIEMRTFVRGNDSCVPFRGDIQKCRE